MKPCKASEELLYSVQEGLWETLAQLFPYFLMHLAFSDSPSPVRVGSIYQERIFATTIQFHVITLVGSAVDSPVIGLFSDHTQQSNH